MLILDTCTFVWLTSEPDRLSTLVKNLIDESEDLFLSDVCIWEICLKWQAKKLELPSPPRRWIAEQTKLWSLRRVPIETEDLFRTSELPHLHKDPFDRLLVAQTMARDAQIITPDAAVHSYPVAVLW